MSIRPLRRFLIGTEVAVLRVKGLETGDEVVEQTVQRLANDARLDRAHDLVGAFDSQPGEAALRAHLVFDEALAIIEDAWALAGV